jgi:hypothetical protein
MTGMTDKLIEAAWAELEGQSKERGNYCSREDWQIDGYIDMSELIRAILSTIREPDGPMLAAANSQTLDMEYEPPFEEIWKAMLDEVIKWLA